MTNDTTIEPGIQAGDEFSAMLRALVLRLDTEAKRVRAEAEALRSACGALIDHVRERGMPCWLLEGSGEIGADGEERSRLERMVDLEYRDRCARDGVPDRSLEIRLSRSLSPSSPRANTTPALPAVVLSNPDTKVVAFPGALVKASTTFSPQEPRS